MAIGYNASTWYSNYETYIDKLNFDTSMSNKTFYGAYSNKTLKYCDSLDGTWIPGCSYETPVTYKFISGNTTASYGDLVDYCSAASQWASFQWCKPKKSPADSLREIIQSRHSPAIASNRYLNHPRDIREVRARETLLRVIGDRKFRSFLKNGFITVRAKSGLCYQIFPGHDFTKVYSKGVLMRSLCVILRGDFPPTDSLIMRYLLILNDEQEFAKMAIEHKVHKKKETNLSADQRSLIEVWRGIKAA